MSQDEDPLKVLCGTMGTKGLNRGELGLLLKQGLLQSRQRLGQVAQLMQNSHVGGQPLSHAPRDVLPLPVRAADPDEHRILTALRGGAQPRDLRRDFARSLPRAAHSAWLFLLVVTLNFMHLGWSDARMLEPQLQPVLTEDIPELSKAAVMAITRYMRAKGFFEVYLDDTLKAELTSDERLVHEVHTVGPMQQALREVYAEWGVSTSAKKALERVPEALVRGGRIGGVAGRGEPSPDKLDKTMCMCWDLIGMRRPD